MGFFDLLICAVAVASAITVDVGAMPSDVNLVQCDADKIKNATSACDSLVAISQIKCEDKACHKALHFLTKSDTIECYVQLGLGSTEELTKYSILDAFCPGEGSDPAEHDDHNHGSDKQEHSNGKTSGPLDAQNGTQSNGSFGANVAEVSTKSQVPEAVKKTLTPETVTKAPTSSPASSVSRLFASRVVGRLYW